MVVAIVDDDWGMLDLVAYILKRKGYTTVAFPDAQECWEWISDPSTTCPDILISDLMMPFMDGRELIAKIRTESHCGHVPILLLSSVGQVEDRRDLWDLFLNKAFTREQFLQAVDDTIERRKSNH
ncbi:MAG: response regulator [Chitinivibrionales bacterium]|nr:response regulator [Chitinivibrionales bacterium]MBD3358542.1 response regulator [Chitinivibrionales bacterium]